MDPFEKERRLFEANKADWIDTHEGEYAIVKGERVLGFKPTLESAVELGYTLTRASRFLVKRVEAREAPVFLPAWVR